MKLGNSGESRKRKATKMILGIIISLGVLVPVNFMPTFQLKTAKMSLLDGNWVNVYYESEKAAAEDVFQYADAETEEIAKRLGFEQKQNVNIYIYDYQSTMQKKKYGYLGAFLGLDWYIGDNIGTDVILTSPANPGKMHDYDNNKYAVLHEIVHAYISVMNPDIQLWLTEGTALYLSNGEEFQKEYLEYMPIPTYEDSCTKNPVHFSNCGGYTFAHTYIAYLDETYGWSKVLELLESENYEQIFGKSKETIYEEWVLYLQTL